MTTTSSSQLPTKRAGIDEDAEVSNQYAGIDIKRAKIDKKKKYNVKLLEISFGSYSLKNVMVNTNYIHRSGLDLPDITFQYLKKNFVMKLNEGKEVSCFRTRNDSLALFDVRIEDVAVLNNLLHFLIEKMNVNLDKNVVEELDKNETLFFRSDRLTSYFDVNCKKIESLPKLSFEGNVAVKVMGLQFHKSKRDDGSQVVKLLIHLEQVRVLDDERTMEEKAECMFANN